MLYAAPPAAIRHIDPSWVVVSQPLKWHSPPRQIENAAKWSLADILVPWPSGDMGEISTISYRERDGQVLITRGDGYVTSVGTWTRQGKMISAQHRVVYREIPRIGQPMPEPVQTTTYQGTHRSDGW